MLRSVSGSSWYLSTIRKFWGRQTVSPSLGALKVAVVDPQIILSDLTPSSLPWPESQCLFCKAGSPLRTGHVPSLSGGKMIPKTTFLPTELPFRRRPPGVPARRPRETVEPRPAARRAGCMWGLLRSGGGCSWSQALACPPVGSLGPRAPAAESLEWIGKRRPTCPELTIFLSRWLQLTRPRKPTGPWAGGKTPRKEHEVPLEIIQEEDGRGCLKELKSYRL
ncbi:PREDICTED: MOB kinase activator 3B isoform X1 [Cercocebus atys]|uniref:MOB kinase activator 3B isoform X1 n=1 Tax=Cercocebus atys TaxID=9531 RepID=UPI0005F53086|nr:PREDICTED: MOB kinase activator 3B isoform X1 [Cercocebus atys]